MASFNYISVLRENCDPPEECGTEDCGFNCETCLDFQFTIRVTFSGITDTVDCSECDTLNYELERGPFGPFSDCNQSFPMLGDFDACGISAVTVDLAPNLIRVTLGGVASALRYQVTGTDILEVLCEGGSIALPFVGQVGFDVLCNGTGSTATIELVPV